MLTQIRARGRVVGLAAALALTVAAVACVQTKERDGGAEPTARPAPTAPATTVPAPASPVATVTAIPAVTATAVAGTAAPPATPVPAPPSPTPIPIGSSPTQFGLFLELQGLSENTVVHGDFIVASGITSPDAVLSINGVIIPLNDDGSFEVTLALDEGPNLLEVVSSDLAGNEESRDLWVVALPTGT